MLSLLFLISLVSAASLDHRHHEHTAAKRLPSSWFHARDHQVNRLFKRGGDGVNYAQVGSQPWLDAFPPSFPDSTKLPAEWVDALNGAVQSGKIPNIPKSSNTPQTNPVYPDGNNPGGAEICSATYKCRNPGDTWDSPEGYFGTSFDDGPYDGTPKLLQFLKDNDQSTTHFMIGMYIRNAPDKFLAAFNQGGDIAVHTYTHRYMTTLSNEDVVAELGWTMEIIHNSTGGRVPKFWRPPYGDSDNRVRAIAKEVFGLHTVIWNQDTEDWSITSGGTTAQKINASMTQWITGPKNPGLMILEHELNDQTVQAFMDAYPLIKSNGWKIESVAQIVEGTSAYQNAAGSDSDTVTPEGILAADGPASSGAASSGGSSVKQTQSSSGSQPTGAASSSGNSTQTGSQQNAALSISRSFPVLWVASLASGLLAILYLA